MKHRHTLVQFQEGANEILDEVDTRLKPQALWGLVSLAMRLGPPLRFGFGVLRTRQLLEGDAV